MTGTLDLVFEPRGGRTVLSHAHATAPLRVGSTYAAGDAAYLILVCTGPGIFGGDLLQQTVHVKRGASVVLVSQSALQVHPSPAGGCARVEHRYVVEDGGELHCQWDPVIPFAAARLDQRFDLDLAADARLYWSDALMCGRAARDERWQFHALAHDLRLRVDGRLKYLERFSLVPLERHVTGPWMAGDARYTATTLMHDARIGAAQAELLQQSLDEVDEVRAGVDRVDDRLLVSRLIGSSGVAFSTARRTVRTFACVSIFGRADPVNRK